jgi:SAM-dependent methyltransferase
MDREQLGRSFDQAAELYQRARPDYPDELFDDLVHHAALSVGDKVLEIGCATGKATLPLAKRGFTITCLEPGPRLASMARLNLHNHDVEVVETRFEEWHPDEGGFFDLVFAATAWHWLDPDLKYVLAHDTLRSGGHLAFWDGLHVFPEDGDPFFQELQDVYEEIGEGLPAGSKWPRPGELEDRRQEITDSGLFEVVHVRHFDWERIYDAEGYIELLETFSGHISMDKWKRERLYGEIRARLARRTDGLVSRHWGCVLHVARRLA